MMKPYMKIERDEFIEWHDQNVDTHAYKVKVKEKS